MFTFTPVSKLLFSAHNMYTVLQALKIIPKLFVVIHKQCFNAISDADFGKSACSWHEIGDKDYQSGLNQSV